MVVDTESAVRYQTLSHFLHTFIHNYDTEAAADRTMRSQYVPMNIKVQLLAAIRECGDEKTDSAKISSIAHMGYYVHSSCDELAYYHLVVSAAIQFCLSLYVQQAHLKNAVKTVLDDMGRIEDDDIHFILEKYKELRSAGRTGDDHASGIERFLSFVKPKKLDPKETSYTGYYMKSLLKKLVRSMLRKVGVFMDKNVFNMGPEATAGPPSSTLPENDTEGRRVYDDYRRHRERLATLAKVDSYDKVRQVMKEETVDERGVATREPPENIVTVFDRAHSSSSADEDDEDCSVTAATTVGTAATFEYRVSPPPGSPDSTGFRSTSSTRASVDLEVEEIFRRAGDGNEYDDEDGGVPTPPPSTGDFNDVVVWNQHHHASLPDTSVEIYDPFAGIVGFDENAVSDDLYGTSAYAKALLDDFGAQLSSSDRGRIRQLEQPSTHAIYRSLPVAVSSRGYNRVTAERATKRITLDNGVENLLRQERIRSLSSDVGGATRTLEKVVLELETRGPRCETGHNGPERPLTLPVRGTRIRPLPSSLPRQIDEDDKPFAAERRLQQLVPFRV